MTVEYAIEVFDSGSGFGPGAKVAELWGARNVGWAAYDRRPGKAFATLSQTDPLLPKLSPLLSHVKVWRITPSGDTIVFSGGFVDYDSAGDDVVLEFYDYLALLSLSRSGFRTMYQSKKIGTEVISAEWALAKGATYSPLAFVTTGTIENPLGMDNLTEMTTSAQFGLLDQPRLQLFYDLSEMGRANTINQVSYGISRTSPHTFTFLRNAGTARDIGLVLNGNVTEYRYLPNWKAYRNDLATLGMDNLGGPGEIVKTDEAEALAKGRRQDVFTIRTLLGVTGATTEADQQQAVAARMLKEATKQTPALMVYLMPGMLAPFDGWDINDLAHVEVSNGIDSITGLHRIAGVQGIYTEEGERLSLITEPVLT
jgi:hypothetical protein